MKPEIDTSILKSISFISDEGTKLEGETCGSCFSPSTNFTCGTCIEGLECVPDENAAMLPDLPSRCRSPQSKIFLKISNQRNKDSSTTFSRFLLQHLFL